MKVVRRIWLFHLYKINTLAIVEVIVGKLRRAWVGELLERARTVELGRLAWHAQTSTPSGTDEKAFGNLHTTKGQMKRVTQPTRYSTSRPTFTPGGMVITPGSIPGRHESHQSPQHPPARLLVALYLSVSASAGQAEAATRRVGPGRGGPGASASLA
jgi:hypothetical protein